MNKLLRILRLAVIAILFAGQYSCAGGEESKGNAAWEEDFQYQPIVNRPKLEVAYTDFSRTAFEIVAEDYNLVGELRNPHMLVNKEDGSPWLWFEMEDADGVKYSTRNYKGDSRINLYRRGPYYCEVHWFDVQPVSENNKVAPLRGDIALFCYPDKILAEITWHATENFVPRAMEVKGLVSKQYTGFKPFEKGTIQNYYFPLFGENDPPLPATAFELLEGENPVKYDPRRGCYIMGSTTNGGFQEMFYDKPNFYETIKFTVSNDDLKRKIYIVQESSDGGQITEGGMVLDKDGHPMPIVVQVSKNFGGEIEEKYYNPTDVSFSETIFPLYLEPGESHTLSSLHLFQNWGRHMTKHWSSLGAWMDYFHSSTGVTETTCYVPFKFAGLGGVAIADFRAMSQEYFWIGQPQHDNIAGHSYLSYFDGKDWIHTVYTGTTYRSTGPNWYDIGLGYLSADGKIKATISLFETPQSDELRSYFNIKYEVLEPLVIEDAKANFRMLNITSRIQSMLYDRYASTSTPETLLDKRQMPFPVKGSPLPNENFFLAVYGDSIKNMGSNGIVIKKFAAPGFSPAGTVQLGAYKEVFDDRPQDTRLLLTANADRLELKKGDVIEIEGYWLPYGAAMDTKSPEKVVKYDAENAPRVVSVAAGEKVADLPTTVKAAGNYAEFTVAGGKNLIPVLVTGFTDWKYPRISVKEGDGWRPLYHSRNWAHDGYQVFCDEDGTFGAIFLIPGSLRERQLRVSVGKEVELLPRQRITVVDRPGTPYQSTVQVGADKPVYLSIPDPTLLFTGDEKFEPVWHQSVGNSLWFTQKLSQWERGGRLNPNEDEIEIEYWWQNNVLRDVRGVRNRDIIGIEPVKLAKWESPDHSAPVYKIDISESPYAGQQIVALVDGEWTNLSGKIDGQVQAVGVRSADGNSILAMAFLNTAGAFQEGNIVGIQLKPVDVPLEKRYHVRGKLYIVDSDQDILKNRIVDDFF